MKVLIITVLFLNAVTVYFPEIFLISPQVIKVAPRIDAGGMSVTKMYCNGVISHWDKRADSHILLI